MDQIIDIQAHRRTSGERAAPQGPAAVIIFPGVRYERARDIDNAAAVAVKADKKSGEAVG